MNKYVGQQARSSLNASNCRLKWLWISCQILLLSSFALLSGCDGGDSSSSTTPASSTSTTTDTTQTSVDTVDETPVYEGFKYLNTAKGVDPRQQEAALLKIKGIDTAKCDGYECDFTFSGRKAVFVYPPETPTDTSSLSISSVNQNLDATVVFTKKFASQNTLSALADAPICPAQTQKKALILFASIGTYFDRSYAVECKIYKGFCR